MSGGLRARYGRGTTVIAWYCRLLIRFQLVTWYIRQGGDRWPQTSFLNSSPDLSVFIPRSLTRFLLSRTSSHRCLKVNKNTSRSFFHCPTPKVWIFNLGSWFWLAPSSNALDLRLAFALNSLVPSSARSPNVFKHFRLTFTCAHSQLRRVFLIFASLCELNPISYYILYLKHFCFQRSHQTSFSIKSPTVSFAASVVKAFPYPKHSASLDRFNSFSRVPNPKPIRSLWYVGSLCKLNSIFYYICQLILFLSALASNIISIKSQAVLLVASVFKVFYTQNTLRPLSQ